MNSITDVGGIRVGHYQRLDPDASLGAGWACGVTVVLPPPGTVGAVDCRGGAPGTRETDLLDPANSVRFVDALLLAGGSAYGLAAADGVMRWLEEHRRGVAMDSGVVPIVPGAVIFDLPVGGWNCRPTADFGYSACAAAGVDVAVGTVGVGVGARAGALKGGVGTASATLQSGVTVGVLAVVNAAGNVVDPATGLPWMADLVGEFALRGHRDHLDSGRLGHLADRQCGQQLWPDRPYRRLWPDLWLAGLPIGVRAFCAQGMGYRHWAGGLVCLWRHPARRDAGAGPVWWRVMAGSFKWCGCWRRGGVSVVRSGA